MTESENHLIDEVLEKWKQQMNRGPSISFGSEHEPQEYIGFTDRYDFCLKCDAKLVDGHWVLKPRP